jgi:hypothetical protein
MRLIHFSSGLLLFGSAYRRENAVSPEHTSDKNEDLRSSGRAEDIFDAARCLTPTSKENVKLNPLDTSLVLLSDVPQITPVLRESGKNEQGVMVTTNILPSFIVKRVLFENLDLSVVTKFISWANELRSEDQSEEEVWDL